MSGNGEWGQLVSLTDFESDPIELKSNTFTIGRAPDCDLSLSDNKLVSGHHCSIERGTDGAVSIQDSSTNGTLLNMKKLTKGQRKLLSHGDEIYLVYKKNNEELNVGYIYQDSNELMKEDSTQEYSPQADILDATLEDSDCNNYSPIKNIATSSKKRKSADEDSETEGSLAKQAKVDETEEKNTTETQPKDVESKEKVSSADSKLENSNMPDVVKPKKEVSSKQEITSSKGDSKEKEQSSKQEMTSSKQEVTSSKQSVTSKDDARDDIEENLQCMICQEIMHDCISLQPCLHSFCAGCYSDWMSRSQECPSCRKNVERINKNHIVNNLIEAYLKEHPGKRRPTEDIEELNSKNKITHDMLYPKDKQVMLDSSDYSDSSDDDTYQNNIARAPMPIVPPIVHFPPPPAHQPITFGFGTPIFGANRAYKTVCRQCPEYKEPADNTGAGVIGGIKNALNTVKNIITGEGNPAAATNNTAPAADKPGTSDDTGGADGGADDTLSYTDNPSTSGEAAGSSTTADKPAFKDDPKESPVAPHYVCIGLQNHVICQCCLQPMPDHRIHTTIPAADQRPQQCGVCHRAFCHAYWGCRKADCLGCLNKFKEMNFGRKCLPGLILDNQFESEIFKDYIDSKGLSVKDVLQECCRQMEAGKFTATAQGTHRLTTDTPVCYGCGINSFKQLAFQYRKTLKLEDLPDKAKNRADCYWGSKCRTQRNKPHHARNFNHICDQTRQY